MKQQTTARKPRRKPGPPPFAQSRLSVMLTEAQERGLADYCDRHVRGRSEVVREAIDRFFEQERRADRHRPQDTTRRGQD